MTKRERSDSHVQKRRKLRIKKYKRGKENPKGGRQRDKKKERLFFTPPPYLPQEGQFPIFKGTVEVSGEMQIEGQVELEYKKETDVKTKRWQRKLS